MAVYRGKNTGKWRECGRYMEARWQVNGGSVAVYKGRWQVNGGKVAGNWRECGR